MAAPTTHSMTNVIASLSESLWTARAASHRAKLSALLGDYLRRRRAGEKNPVVDFLFEYYALRPSRLLRWTPGPGVELRGAAAVQRYEGKPGFSRTDDGVLCDPASYPRRRVEALRWIKDILEATQTRHAFGGCFALHEWAMVYRLDEATERVRHPRLPMRLEADALNAVVESMPIACSHWDAYRFFSRAATPLNRQQPTPEGQRSLEQPGCLHTNMDIYRWCIKLYPWLEGELLAEAFALALEARFVDMRASPYDVRQLGLDGFLLASKRTQVASGPGLRPLAVETPEGRREFQREQRRVTEMAAPVRRRLIEAIDTLLRLLPVRV